MMVAMDLIWILLGASLVGVALADLINTLVTTTTADGRWWPSRIIGHGLFRAVRSVAARLDPDSPRRERVLSVFGPVLLLVLLVGWIVLQVVGFALIWYGLDDIAGVTSIGDAIYYSGVVFFTVGFGEVLPTAGGPRIGALVEAGSGVVTTALVIGYLPSLYSAYSAREQKLMTIDDGSGDRITPTNLVVAWAPNADVDRLNARMAEWEQWVAGILETHSTLRLLQFFRSHDRRQNWVTALGLLSDVAIHSQIIAVNAGKTESYWFLRRAVTLFEELTEGLDLDSYIEEHSIVPDDPSVAAGDSMFADLYDTLEAHGFDLLPYEDAVVHAAQLRNRWAPHMEALIDKLLCPRGFWCASSTPLLAADAPIRPD